jgi:hypothetical protein
MLTILILVNVYRVLRNLPFIINRSMYAKSAHGMLDIMLINKFVRASVVRFRFT